MIHKTDFSAKEVPAPPQHWCKSGHFAPKKFRREGAGTPEEPTKFFSVYAASNSSVSGVYCEPCLIVANYQSAQTRKATRP